MEFRRTMDGISDIVQEAVIKTMPRKEKCKNAKWFYNKGVVIVMQPMKKLQINELYNLTGKFMLHVQHINK